MSPLAPSGPFVLTLSTLLLLDVLRIGASGGGISSLSSLVIPNMIFAFFKFFFKDLIISYLKPRLLRPVLRLQDLRVYFVHVWEECAGNLLIALLYLSNLLHCHL